MIRRKEIQHGILRTFSRPGNPERTIKGMVIQISLLICGIIILGWLYVLWLEDRSIYFPDKIIIQTPDALDLGYEDRFIEADDGIRLHAWYIPKRDARFILLHFHGNGGNISHRLQLYKLWHDMGLGVFALDYRGFGRSRGHPYESGLYADARAAWQELTGKLAVPHDQIIIAGRSLGCAPATYLAAQTDAAGLVLETPFTSLPDMAGKLYPWLPARFLVRTQFNNMKRIPDVNTPVLIMTAEGDEITPQWMGRRLFEAAHEPRQYAAFTGGHNDFNQLSGREYLRTWSIFLESVSVNAQDKNNKEESLPH